MESFSLQATMEKERSWACLALLLLLPAVGSCSILT